ncbi:hypothetical protein TWF694_004738 [Orbilia ellipsospora]|uniref:Uncharacterized protein n=1 Tax=Orbilia ellipsospora TaxID=2528407 RepID=A0AAV9WW29_9PEZI
MKFSLFAIGTISFLSAGLAAPAPDAAALTMPMEDQSPNPALDKRWSIYVGVYSVGQPGIRFTFTDSTQCQNVNLGTITSIDTGGHWCIVYWGSWCSNQASGAFTGTYSVQGYYGSLNCWS